MKELLDTYSEIKAVAEGENEVIIYVKGNPPRLPRSFDGKPVRYVQTEGFYAFDRTQKFRPFQGSVSIGHKDVTAGTFSLLVRDKTTKEPLLLSNNHVLANVNKGKPGDLIYQPGKADGGTEPVAKLERFFPLEDGATIDAAVARPFENMVKPGIYEILPEINYWKNPYVNQPVGKIGRTTDKTYGKVSAINASVKVWYGNKEILLKDIFICDLKGAPGDSGSPIIERGAVFSIVGILFAGNSTQTLGCKFSNIMDLLNIELYPEEKQVLLDLSHYNGRITDVSKMKNVLGVFLKCTQGDYYFDDKFAENWDILKTNKIPVGAYIFLDFTKCAEAHFEYFKKNFGNRVADLPIALDCELDYKASREKITSTIQQLAKLIEDYTKKPPIIYTRASWWNAYVLPWSGWKRYGLWVARYNTDLPTWYGDTYKIRDWDTWDLWQYSADGNNEGNKYGVESKSVDKNIPNKSFIEKYLSGNPVPQPPEEPSPKTYGTVLVDNLRIRTTPSINGQVVGYLPKNERVGIVELITIDSNNVWAKLGENKYSAVKYLGTHYIQVDGEEIPKRKGKVVVNKLNIRNAPTLQSDIVGTLKYNDVIDILDVIVVQNNVWAKIGLDKFCAMLYNNQSYVIFI